MARTVEPRAATTKSVVSQKVTLRGTKPPIWHRLLVPGAMTLGALHEAIQAAMGWQGGPLHAFDIDGRQYGDRRTVDDVADENRLTLSGVLKSGVTRFGYIYDFGDDWDHTVAIEKSSPPSTAKPIPPASPASATVRRKIAAAFGAMQNCSKFLPTPPTRNAPSASNGSAKTSTPSTSLSPSPMPPSLPASTENDAPPPQKPKPRPTWLSR